MAYSHFDSGSSFTVSVAEGLQGRAANANGVVTVERLFHFVRTRMSLGDSRGQTPHLYLRGDIRDFALTYGGGINTSVGRRRALLVASDSYRDQTWYLPHNENSVRLIADALGSAGGFEIFNPAWFRCNST
jgi:hypothetical protein